jgi:hypothetical protein
VTNAKETFQRFLKRIGQLEDVRLGGRPATARVTEEDNQYLKGCIQSARDSTKWMLGVMIGMLIVVFCIGVFFVIQAVSSIGALVAISAGMLVTLLAIIERLRRLWVEQAILNLTWASVREWPPENVLALVELLYWHSLSPSRKRTKLSAKSSQGAKPLG